MINNLNLSIKREWQFRANLFLIALVFCVQITGCKGQKENDELESKLARIENAVGELRDEVIKLRQDVVSSQQTAAKGNETGVGKTSPEAAIVKASYKMSIDALDDPYYGPANAPLLIMVFTDYQCAPCRKFFEDSFENLRKEYADTGIAKLVLRDFPLEHNKFAHQAAEFAHCAGEQSHYWECSSMLRSKTEELDAGDFKTLMTLIPGVDAERLESCFTKKRYEREVDADIVEGRTLGAQGAPGTFIGKLEEGATIETKDASYNGVFIRGAQPYGLLAHQIKKVNGN